MLYYEVVSYEDYRQLQERIGSVLDDIYNNLSFGEGRGEVVQQPKPAEKKSEPVKTRRSKAPAYQTNKMGNRKRAKK